MKTMNKDLKIYEISIGGDFTPAATVNVVAESLILAHDELLKLHPNGIISMIREVGEVYLLADN